MKESKEEPNQVGEKAEPNLYGQLLAIRDCLIRNDKDEAYHIPGVSTIWVSFDFNSHAVRSAVEELSEKEFCRMYTQYHGEEINNIRQLVSASFSGEELMEFVQHCLKSRPSVVGESQIKELEATIDNLRNQIEYAAEATREYLVREKEEQRWISVKERLPENRTRVIAYGHYGAKHDSFICLYIVDYTGNGTWYCLGNKIEAVTHWMPPLPSPPKV